MGSYNQESNLTLILNTIFAIKETKSVENDIDANQKKHKIIKPA